MPVSIYATKLPPLTTSPTPAEIEAAQHARDLKRYLNVDIPARPGIKRVAVVAVGSDGMIDDALGNLLCDLVRTDQNEPILDFFTPEFISDGLFRETFDGSHDIFARLELMQSIKSLLLARETIRLETNSASLDNVLTATLQLEVKAVSPSFGIGNKGWQFEATGAGFKPEDARSLAEERIFKKLTNNTPISIN